MLNQEIIGIKAGKPEPELPEKSPNLTFVKFILYIGV